MYVLTKKVKLKKSVFYIFGIGCVFLCMQHVTILKTSYLTLFFYFVFKIKINIFHINFKLIVVSIKSLILTNPMF